jgi:hypothetical protein
MKDDPFFSTLLISTPYRELENDAEVWRDPLRLLGDIGGESDIGIIPPEDILELEEYACGRELEDDEGCV